MSDPLLVAAREILDMAVADMSGAVEGASPESLNRRPAGDDTNSLAVLAVHTMHSTRSWLSVAVKAPPPERNRDDEFIATMPDASALVRFLASMQADCVRILDSAEGVDWASTRRTHARPNPDDASRVTAAWALLHALEHMREHTGQMLLTRQVLDGGRAG